MKINLKSKLVLVLIVTGLFACSKKEDAQGAKSAGMPPMPVDVALPVKQMQDIWDTYGGRLTESKYVDVRARVGGYLEKICFKDGDYVKEGDVLFKIDARPYIAVVKECQARINECQVRITLAKSNMQRAEELIKTRAISNEVLETRKAELLSAEAANLSAEARLIEANLNLEFTTVKAPISGFMSKRLVDEGNLVNASTTPLTTIVSQDIIYASFFVSERDMLIYNQSGLLKDFKDPEVLAGKKSVRGPDAKLTLMGETIPHESGVLTYVGNTLSNGSIEFRAEFPNKDGKLIPGTYAKIYLKVAEAKERIMVPELAVQTDLAYRFVLIVNDKNIVEYRKVTVGNVIDGLQIVTDGLKGDERVVVNGLQRAIPGKAVTPILKK